MATNNPLRKTLNRAEQLPRGDVESRRGISLYDVDNAIFNYMNDIVFSVYFHLKNELMGSLLQNQ